MRPFPPSSAKTGMLASVTNLEEAEVALEGNADIIDLKDPARGALGALDYPQVRAIVRYVAGAVPLSATTGDDPEMNPLTMQETIRRMADTGVDIVKIGFFPSPSMRSCIEASARIAEQGVRLVAVLFGDLGTDKILASEIAAAGFFGVMLDTAEKNKGSLRDHLSEERLAQFVADARNHGLISGLAGSLRIGDIPVLLSMHPDYLGFRGALCQVGLRTAKLDPAAFSRVRRAMTQEVLQRASESYCESVDMR